MNLTEFIGRIKGKRIILIVSFAGLMILGFIMAPVVYRKSVNRRFAAEMDGRFGADGWVVIRMGADNQPDEQINLYRTLYVARFYPKYQNYTPWKNLHFTHKTTVPTKPWHYWITIYADDVQITSYWSMREGRWIVAWESPVLDWERQEYDDAFSGIERRGGLNHPAE